MASQEVHEDEQRERKKRQQTRRERKRTSGRQERMCGLPFSPSGAMVTCRAVAQRRKGINVSPNQDKTVSQKVLKVVKNKGTKFTNWGAYVDIKYFKGSDRTMTKRSVLILTVMNSSGMNGAPTSKLFIAEVTLLVVTKVCWSAVVLKTKGHFISAVNNSGRGAWRVPEAVTLRRYIWVLIR